MIEFQVSDMSCEHCAGAITRAVQAVDASARVEVDLAAKRVRIAAASGAETFAQAIREAGYTPLAAPAPAG